MGAPTADLSESIALRARECPGVVRVTAGAFGTVATPLPGGRVEGVAVRADAVDIAIVARLERPLPELAVCLRAAVAPLVPERAVNIMIEDVVAPVKRP